MNSRVISFLNGLFGFIIFGCLWNSNLTNKRKGISNVVYAVLHVVILLVAGLRILFIGMALP
jgi:hypothetical protein